MRTAGYQLGRHCNRPGNNVKGAQLCEKEETDFKIRNLGADWKSWMKDEDKRNQGWIWA